MEQEPPRILKKESQCLCQNGYKLYHSISIESKKYIRLYRNWGLPKSHRRAISCLSEQSAEEELPVCPDLSG